MAACSPRPEQILVPRLHDFAQQSIGNLIWPYWQLLKNITTPSLIANTKQVVKPAYRMPPVLIVRASLSQREYLSEIADQDQKSNLEQLWRQVDLRDKDFRSAQASAPENPGVYYILGGRIRCLTALLYDVTIAYEDLQCDQDIEEIERMIRKFDYPPALNLSDRFIGQGVNWSLYDSQGRSYSRVADKVTFVEYQQGQTPLLSLDEWVKRLIEDQQIPDAVLQKYRSESMRRRR